MPALDEGTTLDMPVTVPRASVTQATDDLKARDALLRGFPEVESVVGKAGRADTPTDPAPLDMVETFVNYRPHELWPKRVVRYVDAAKLTESAFNRLIGDGFVVEPTDSDERNNLVNDATQRSLERFDESMRELALARYGDIESDLEIQLVRFVVNRVIEQVEVTRQWTDKASDEAKKVILERLTSTFLRITGTGSRDRRHRKM